MNFDYYGLFSKCTLSGNVTLIQPFVGLLNTADGCAVILFIYFPPKEQSAWGAPTPNGVS